MAEHFSIGTAGTRVNLVNTSGFDTKAGWKPRAGDYDDVFQESTLADYRQLATYRDITVIETIPLALRASSQDNAASQTQELRQLLRTARNYWVTTWQDDLVYLQLQGSAETNARYAIVHAGRLPDDQSVLSCWMEGANPTRAIMPDMNLIVERGPWLENAPGTGTAVELSALEAYDGRNLGNVDSSGVRDPTTADGAVFIANKQNEANLSDVYYWRETESTWSANLMDAGLPYSFLIGTRALVVGDCVIFGIDTSLSDSGPFCSLVFDISTAITGTVTIEWRYRDSNNGDAVDPSTWTALTVQDNTNADGIMSGDAFDTTGIHSVHWEQPEYWQTANPDPTGADALGVTGYWVCAYVTAVSGLTTPPYQQHRDIYSVIWPYTEINTDQTGGDLPMLTRIRVRDQAGGVSTGDRIVVGLRSMDRGSNFRSHVNISNEQNGPFSITLTGAGVGYNTDPTAPTGKTLRILNPAASWPSPEQVVIEIRQGYVDEFIGDYRVFLRVHQTSGSVGDISIRLRQTWFSVSQVVNYSYTAAKQPATTNDWETIDFGRISIPTVTWFRPTDSFYVYYIGIQVYGDGAADIELYDLILIPIDEWAVDCLDTEHETWFEHRETGNVKGVYLDIDSIGYPKRAIAAIAREYDGNDLVMVPTTRGAPAKLQRTGTQRLYFLVMGQAATSANTSYIHGGASVTVNRAKRYASMRGAD